MKPRLDPHRIRRDLTGLAALHKPTPRATLSLAFIAIAPEVIWPVPGSAAHAPA